MSGWKPVRVTISMGDSEIDAMGVVDAYTRGDRWNGWVTPYFDEPQAHRVAAWTRALREKFPDLEVETVAWDDDLKAFVLEDPQYPHATGEPIPGEDIVAGIRGEEPAPVLYGIGSYKWAWEEVSGS
jgi:hypothetical protein